MVRGLIVGSVAFAAAFVLERQFEVLSQDIVRYDRMRAMSGDPPFWREQLGNLMSLFGEYGNSRRGEAIGFLEGMQNDLVRYARISTM